MIQLVFIPFLNTFPFVNTITPPECPATIISQIELTAIPAGLIHNLITMTGLPSWVGWIWTNTGLPCTGLWECTVQDTCLTLSYQCDWSIIERLQMAVNFDVASWFVLRQYTKFRYFIHLGFICSLLASSALPQVTISTGSWTTLASGRAEPQHSSSRPSPAPFSYPSGECERLPTKRGVPNSGVGECIQRWRIELN